MKPLPRILWSFIFIDQSSTSEDDDDVNRRIEDLVKHEAEVNNWPQCEWVKDRSMSDLVRKEYNYYIVVVKEKVEQE